MKYSCSTHSHNLERSKLIATQDIRESRNYKRIFEAFVNKIFLAD